MEFKVCPTCKKEYKTRKSIQKYCSYTCRNKNLDWKKNLKGKHNHLGDNNPKWRGGKSIGYQLRICRNILIKNNRDLTHCERCGVNGSLDILGKLNIHHKDRNRNNNINPNMEVICSSCHRFEHMKEWRDSYENIRR